MLSESTSSSVAVTHQSGASSSAAGPGQQRRRYWRSLDELSKDGTAHLRLGDEFAPDADVWLDPVSRRNFLTIMGASLALAGLVGCDDFPEEQVVPYVNQPESVVAGTPSLYATTMPLNGFGMGVLAQSHEGRPTKIEGNPDHPSSLGAANVFMQASVLDLYDPDRSKLITHGGLSSDWGAFHTELRRQLDPQRGKGDGIRILSRTITSPTFSVQLAALKQQFPGLRWHVWDPTSSAGCSARVSGATRRSVYDFSKADVILSLDADFLVNDVGSLAYARQFADGRRRQPGLAAARQTLNRLYVVEGALTLTGSMADHRIAIKPSQITEVARAIGAALGVPSASGALAPGGTEKFVRAVAADLREPHSAVEGGNRSGVGVVVVGDHQPPELQKLAFEINQLLGSIGKAVRYIDPPEVGGAQTLQSLVADMDSGQVQTLLIFGGNPVYDAPVDVPFTAALQRLTTARDEHGKSQYLTVHLASREDETSFDCQWHVPESHYLETWGDARAYDGTASIIQPLILPMSAASRSLCEMMEALLGRADTSGLEAVRATWEQQWAAGNPRLSQTQPSDTQQAATQPAETGRENPPAKTQRDARTFEEWWRLVLQKGVIDVSASESKEFDPAGLTQSTMPHAKSEGAWEITFRPDPTVWDGQFANNPWLQELPKPFTKLVWDNAAMISYRSAQKLGVIDGNIIRVTLGGRMLEMPVAVVPGTADETLTLTLGYGRTRAGRVGAEENGSTRGTNAYALRTADSGGYQGGVSVEVIRGSSANLVFTHNHHAMTDLPGYKIPHESSLLAPKAIEHPGMSEEEIEVHNRKIVRSATLEDFRRDEDWVTKLGGEIEMRAKGLSQDFPGRKIHLTLYPGTAAEGGWDYSKGYQWGMSIDQNTCIGCNACVVACQAENNIAVVGKDECSRQREMHWIRIDDWFGSQPGRPDGDPIDDPQVVHMPVPCQHCENAPCELVCPVGATSHSVEGVNQMTYNRCIGTRYCSNNCPYKVRRFNFLLYSDYSPARGLQFNPDVTVRSRGVMEKCTFCQQRLSRTKIAVENMTVQLEERARNMEHDAPQRAAALRASLPGKQRAMLNQLQTACQQSCPTRAITFGDKNDPQSAVAKLKDDKLDYTLLADLTTQPRTSYMPRLRNANPAI